VGGGVSEVRAISRRRDDILIVVYDAWEMLSRIQLLSRTFLWSCFALGLAIVLANIAVIGAGELYRVDEAEVEENGVVVVFGARVYPSGEPTRTLAARVDGGALVVRFAPDRVLFLSGGVVYKGDEPAAMRERALDWGVPESQIVLDEQGISTAATCSNVRETFGTDRPVYLVTQAYHTGRAVLLCRFGYGVNAYALPVRNQLPYRDRFRVSNYIREWGARVSSIIQVAALRAF